MKKEKIRYVNLYTTFFKVGLFTFGGGLAMLPIIEREVVDNKKWATYEEIIDYYAISQATPGIIMINVATIIGYKERGLLGAILATLGVVSPSLIIITLIASLIENFADFPIVKSALKGIGAGISGIMLASLIKLGKSSLKDPLSYVLCLIGICVSYFTNINIVYIVIFGILIGIIKYKVLGVKK